MKQFYDICWECDGTGERCFISGARCLTCNGTGVIYEDDEPEYYDDDELEDE